MLFLGERSSQSECALFGPFRSFFRRIKAVPSVAYARDSYVGAPATVFCFPHIFEPASVVNRGVTIEQILRRRGFAHIFPTIVRPVFVNMVNFMFGPRASHPQPNDAVRVIMPSLDNNSNVTVFGYRSSLGAWSDAVGWGIQVIKQPRIGVIREKMSHILTGEISISVFVASDHIGTLAQMPLLVN